VEVNTVKRVVIGAAAPFLALACGGPAASTSSAAHAPVTFTVRAMPTSDLGQILVDAKGKTLYFFMSENSGQVICTGDCTRTWSPLLLVGAPTPTTQSQLPGKLDVIARPDGARQVTYNQWPLYTFLGDRKPGDRLGDGSSGQWFVVKATQPVPVPPTPEPPPPPPPPPPPTEQPAAPPAPRPMTPVPMRPTPIPFGNDGDADNRGGPNDGDGNK
jgi:predicted lipoprotein with Yx(FWY)xxD motif